MTILMGHTIQLFTHNPHRWSLIPEIICLTSYKIKYPQTSPFSIFVSVQKLIKLDYSVAYPHTEYELNCQTSHFRMLIFCPHENHYEYDTEQNGTKTNKMLTKHRFLFLIYLLRPFIAPRAMRMQPLQL